MRLSRLDQAPVIIGNQPADPLIKAEKLAVSGDALGYHRMWMAEHTMGQIILRVPHQK